MHRTLREEKGHYLKNYILLLMTNNKRVLLTIGLAHRNYKTVILLLSLWDERAGGGSKFERLWFLDEDIELK